MELRFKYKCISWNANPFRPSNYCINLHLFNYVWDWNCSYEIWTDEIVHNEILRLNIWNPLSRETKKGKLTYINDNPHIQISYHSKGFPGGSVVKNSPAMLEMWVQSLGQEDLLEKKMATHACFLACILNTPVFPCIEGLVGYSPRGRKKNQTQLSG